MVEPFKQAASSIRLSLSRWQELKDFLQSGNNILGHLKETPHPVRRKKYVRIYVVLYVS